MRIRTADKDVRYDRLVTELALARANKAQVEASIAELENQLINQMEADSRKSVSSGDVQVTYVRSTRIEVNEEGLRKSIGAKAFKKVAVLKLDRKKLEQALDDDQISPEQVSPFIVEKMSKPHLRVTERKKADEA